jgi:hypothetical protein
MHTTLLVLPPLDFIRWITHINNMNPKISQIWQLFFMLLHKDVLIFFGVKDVLISCEEPPS